MVLGIQSLKYWNEFEAPGVWWAMIGVRGWAGFNENLGVFRKYDAKSVKDLLLALRIKVRTVLSLCCMAHSYIGFVLRNTIIRTYRRT